MKADPCDHLVQAYTDDAFLVGIVGEYVAAGLDGGEAVILIATPAHLDALQARLAAEGIGVAARRETGQLRCLDASRTLAAFMVDGSPDRSAFRGVIVAALDHARTAGHRRIRCFGEMVDLLWKDNLPAAIELEALWNELLGDQRVSLLCGYRLDPLDGRVRGVLHQVSRCHSRVLPVEEAESIADALDRAWEDVFGVPGDAVMLRRLVVADRAGLPRAQATIFALHELSPLLADQVLERGRHYFRSGRLSA